MAEETSTDTSDTSTNVTIPAQAPQPQQSDRPNLAEQARNLMQKHDGEATAAIATLLSENHGYRSELRDLKSTLQDLEAKLPGEGMTVLKQSEAETLKAFRELGKPDELKQTLTELEDLRGRVRQFERRELIQLAAKDPENPERNRYKPSVLMELLGNTEIVKGEGEDEGFFVILGEDQRKPLNEWIEQDKKDFIPALKPQPTQVGGDSNPGGPKAVDYRTMTQEEVNAQLRQLGVQPTRF